MTSLDKNETMDIWTACALDRIDILKVLLAESADPANEISSDHHTFRDGFQAYPLHFAARYGSVNAIRLLLDHGASVTARSGDGSLPIHDAAFMGHLEALKTLIENGSPIDDRDLTYQATPLGAAQYAGRTDVVAYLQAHGGDR